MSTAPTSRTLLSLFAAGALSMGLACVITTSGNGNSSGSDDCDSLLGHNHSANGQCYCDAGYTWEDPNDPNNLDCQRIPSRGGDSTSCSEPHNVLNGSDCYCEDGYTWCDPNDPNSYCCEPAPGKQGGGTDGTDDSTSTDGTAGAGTGADTGSGDTGPLNIEPDPADCTADGEGLQFCNNLDADNVEGSRFWVCTAGQWVESPTVGDETCQFEQSDFAYGCYDDGSLIQFVCGVGSGQACEGDAASCVDADQLEYCHMGKMSADSCQRICSEVGDAEDVTYENGVCSENDCCCYDSGDEANCGL